MKKKKAPQGRLYGASGVRHDRSVLPTLVPTFRSSSWGSAEEMSRALTEEDVAEVIGFLSPDRLQPFRDRARTDRGAVRLHQLSMQLGSALMPVVGTIEIALRNATCDVLSLRFGARDWLRNPPPPFTWKGDERNTIDRAVLSAKKAVYAKIGNRTKAELDDVAFPQGVPHQIRHDTHTKHRQKAIVVSDGQVIAQFSLYFWKRLYSSDYQNSLWKPALRSVFPNKTIRREDVAERLEVLYVCRNRIAHHEPISSTRLDATLSAIAFMSENFRVRRPSADTPLAKILDAHRSMLDDAVDAFRIGAAGPEAADGPIREGRFDPV